jgi:hypothetical protein
LAVAVEPSKCLARLAFIVALVVAAGMALSCVDVRGGAVEFSWTIRKQEGGACSCADAGIVEIKLKATPCDTLLADGRCDGTTQYHPKWFWACSESHASTEFGVEEGRWAFEIEPLTQNMNPVVGAAVPPPIVRDVVNGEVVMLDALLITVECTTP